MSKRIEELVASIKRQTDHYADQDFYDVDIEELLRKFAIEMCEKQKAICLKQVIVGKKGAIGTYWYNADVVVDNNSILNSPLPEELC